MKTEIKPMPGQEQDAGQPLVDPAQSLLRSKTVIFKDDSKRSVLPTGKSPDLVCFSHLSIKGRSIC
jgi:hypothetical protein